MDFNLIILLGLYSLFAAFIAPILACIAFQATRQHERKIAALRAEVRFMQAQLAHSIDNQERSPVPEAAPPTEEHTASADVVPEQKDMAPKPAWRKKPEQPPKSPEPISVQASAPSSQEPTATRPRADQPSTSTFSNGLEMLMGGRYLVWLGGLIVLLGSIFLVKYSITEGLLSPTLRVILGVLLGITLSAVSEWVRIKRPVRSTQGVLTPDRVSISLSFAGVGTVFGSVYAAFALHGLIDAGAAFVALAVICLAASVLSIRQGKPLAVLSVVSTFSIPLLIPSQEPSILLLNGYLLLVAFVGCLTARKLRSEAVVNVVLTGLTGWILVEWLGQTFETKNDLWSLYLILTLMPLQFLLTRGAETTSGKQVVVATGWGGAAMAWLVTYTEGVTLSTLPGLIAVVMVLAGLSLRYRWLSWMILASALLAVAAYVQWLAPQGEILFFVLGLWDSQAVDTFLYGSLRSAGQIWMWGGLLALTFAITAGWRLRRSKPEEENSILWAIVAAGVPAAILVLQHWSMPDFFSAMDINNGTVVADQGAFFNSLNTTIWGFLFVLLSTAYGATAGWLAVQKDRDDAAALFAVVAVTLLIYGGAVSLDRTALTTGLAALLAMLAWMTARFRVPGMIVSTIGVAGLLLVRLVSIHWLQDQVLAGGASPTVLLTSFGAAALGFHLSALFLLRDNTAEDLKSAGLGMEVCAAFLALITGSLLLRYQFVVWGGSSYSLTEQGIQSLLWLGSGIAFYLRGCRHGGHGDAFIGRVAMTLGALHVVLLQVLLHLPLFSDEPVGEWPFLNALLPAYLLPGIAFVVLAGRARKLEERPLSLAAGAVAVALIFVYITLAVRQVFQGSILYISLPTGDGEWYAYSAAWLIAGVAILVMGLMRNIAELRHLSLGVILVVVAKAFLWDMSSLDGLYRVASFLGLGLSLIGIGYLYQRVIPRLAVKE